MSAVLRQTHASPIHGECRAGWCWEGEAFTRYGAWVPKEVIAQDEALRLEGLTPPSDEEVLDDLSPILSPAVLPPGSVLSEPPPKVDKAKLQAIRARLIANAQAATAEAASAPVAAAPGDEVGDPANAIELAVARRESAEKDERLNAAAAENDALKRRLDALEAALAKSGTPGSETVTPPVTPADPMAEVTGGGARKQPTK